MAIEGASLAEAARKFCDHFNSVLFHTLTQSRLQPIMRRGDPFATISFRREGRTATASLGTHYGRLELYLQQRCSSIVKNDRHILRTERYRYALSLTPDAEPILRWEYARTPEPDNRHPRHHLHVDTVINVYGNPLPLKDLHLATGYVPFEEIIRFCIVELGVSPLKADWEERLNESYRLFKSEFTE